MTARLLFVVAAAFAVAARLTFPREPLSTTAATPAPARWSVVHIAPSQSAAPPIATLAAATPADAPIPPRSLAGTELDGRWTRDARDRLVASPDIIRLFDYFLSASGEVSPAIIRAQVAATANAQLPAADREAAMALFDRYVAYRAAAAAALADVAPKDPRAALAVVETTQQQLFGSDAAALFGDENALAEVALDTRALWARDDLDSETRAAQLAALEARLPPAMRDARAARAQLAATVARAIAHP